MGSKAAGGARFGPVAASGQAPEAQGVVLGQAFDFNFLDPFEAERLELREPEDRLGDDELRRLLDELDGRDDDRLELRELEDDELDEPPLQLGFGLEGRLDELEDPQESRRLLLLGWL